MGARHRKPQRKTHLTPQQEYARVTLAWQSFDRAQYVAVSGTDEELLEQCPNPALWRQQLPQTVWIMWGHAPVWLKFTGEKRLLYSEAEAEAPVKRRRISAKTKQAQAAY